MSKTMAAVLAEHAFTERDSMYCKADGCFWHYDPVDDLDRLIAEHQQDMLSAAGFGLVADAKAEALREAAREMREERSTWCLDDSGRHWIKRTLDELEERAAS